MAKSLNNKTLLHQIILLGILWQNALSQVSNKQCKTLTSINNRLFGSNPFISNERVLVFELFK